VTEDAKGTPGLFSEDELILDELASLNPDTLTPLQALEKIHRWKESLSH
jgi:DNA mismatch repair protein MutS